MEGFWKRIQVASKTKLSSIFQKPHYYFHEAPFTHHEYAPTETVVAKNFEKGKFILLKIPTVPSWNLFYVHTEKSICPDICSVCITRFKMNQYVTLDLHSTYAYV